MKRLREAKIKSSKPKQLKIDFHVNIIADYIKAREQYFSSVEKPMN